jgi:hypothetical protein
MNSQDSISLKNVDDFYHKIYFESSEEFEKIRSLCLQENNWLGYLYTKENLKIEQHLGYGVIFYKETDEPVGMAGVFNDGRYPSNVARHLHREYLFPKFRQKTRQGLLEMFTLYREHLLYPLSSINNFEVYILAVQNRDKKVSKGYWNIFSKTVVEAAPEWKIGDGYLQTCPFNVQKCWQNFVYTENIPGAFDKWNPKIITHEDWEKMEPGI